MTSKRLAELNRAVLIRRLILEGLSDEEVAGRVNISRATVSQHRIGIGIRRNRKALPSSLPLAERLQRQAIINESGCWEWIGTKQGTGYGYFSPQPNTSRLAHRVSYEVFVGQIPDGFVVHHKCHNTMCINPDHLEPMTASDHRAEHAA